MTPEDHAAIRAILREELAAAEQRMTEAIRASEQATAANLADLRNELTARISAADVRADHQAEA